MAIAGNIQIDAELNDKGIEQGATRVNNSVLKLSRAFRIMGGSSIRQIRAVQYALDAMNDSVLASMGTIGTLIAAVAAASLVGILALVGAVTSSMKAFYDLDGSMQTLKDHLQDLKNAWAVAFSPLWELITPYIENVVHWLFDLFNKIAMITAALLGQKQVWQAVWGGTEQAAKSADKAAKATEKQKKAAQGALAAFDKINVLQKKTEELTPETPTPPGKGLNGPAFKLVDVTKEMEQHASNVQSILQRLWNDIKTGNFPKLFRDLWTIISTIATEAWKDFQKLWAPIGGWFNEHVIFPLGAFFKGLWDNVSKWAAQTWESIKKWAAGIWKDIRDPFVEAWGEIKAKAIEAWDSITKWASDTWKHIVNTWGNVKQWFVEKWEAVKASASGVWDNIKTKASDAWQHITQVWGDIQQWFTVHITDPIKNAFGTALDWVKGKWETIFDGLGGFLKGVINHIIDLINGMLNGLTGGINGLIDAANLVGNLLPGFNPIPPLSAPHIPYLATGAVIPPNSQFMAVLGDQKSGRNIEAPEALLQDMLNQAVARGGGGDIVTHLQIRLDSGVLYEGIAREQKRRGASLVVGGSFGKPNLFHTSG